MSTMLIVILVIAGVVAVNMAKPKDGARGGRAGGRSNISRPSAPLRTPPECLGVPAGHPARAAAERLEAALTPDFEARVKDRVLRAEPRLREGEWQWRWFELKRYFLMCGVLRGVPMYSTQVDEVWHEMLMFTREYEEFCKTFCGQLIHHAPHTADSQPDRGERAWFDWIYGELFLPVSGSAQLWGPFYRTPMPQSLMQELQTRSAPELRGARFNSRSGELFPDLAAAIGYLIERGRKLAASRDEPLTDNGSDWMSAGMVTGMMSGAFFFSSWGPADLFPSQMDQYRNEEELRQGGTGSACGSSFACSGGGTDNGGNGGDGSSCSGNCSGGSDGGSGGGDSGGGGSSCGSGSSCGGGGGSSCGGGS